MGSSTDPLSVDDLFRELLRNQKQKSNLLITYRQLKKDEEKLVKDLHERGACALKIEQILDGSYEQLTDNNRNASGSDDDEESIRMKQVDRRGLQLLQANQVQVRRQGLLQPIASADATVITASDMGEFVNDKLRAYQSKLDLIEKEQDALKEKHKLELGCLLERKESIVQARKRECENAQVKLYEFADGPSMKRRRTMTPPPLPGIAPSRPRDLPKFRQKSRFPAAAEGWVKRVLQNVTRVAVYSKSTLKQKQVDIEKATGCKGQIISKVMQGLLETSEAGTFHKLSTWALQIAQNNTIPGLEVDLLTNSKIEFE